MVECPYCHDMQEPDMEGYDDETHEQECVTCHMVFAYDAEIDIHYHAWKAPCMNGGEHDLRDIIGWPEEYWANRRRCQNCGEEVVLISPKLEAE
jgi:hypothetical protein